MKPELGGLRQLALVGEQRPPQVPAGWRPLPADAARELKALVAVETEETGWPASSVPWLSGVVATRRGRRTRHYLGPVTRRPPPERAAPVSC